MGKREHDKVYEFIMKRYKQRAEPTTVRIAANALHMKEDNIANILEHMTEQGRVITIGKRTRPQQYWPPIAGKNIKPERDIAANTARLKHDLEALIDRGEATGLNVHNFQLWTKLRVLTVIGRERREDDSGDYEVWRKQGLRPDSVNKSIPLVAVVNANRLTAHLYPDGVLNITNSITQNPLPLETEAGMDNVLITLGQWREALAEKFSLHHSLPLPQEWILKQADFVKVRKIKYVLLYRN